MVHWARAAAALAAATSSPAAASFSRLTWLILTISRSYSACATLRKVTATAAPVLLMSTVSLMALTYLLEALCQGFQHGAVLVGRGDGRLVRQRLLQCRRGARQRLVDGFHFLLVEAHRRVADRAVDQSVEVAQPRLESGRKRVARQPLLVQRVQRMTLGCKAPRLRPTRTARAAAGTRPAPAAAWRAAEGGRASSSMQVPAAGVADHLNATEPT